MILDDQRKQLAKELLEFAENDLIQNRAFTPGRENAELIVVALYFKITAGFEAILTLAEKGLPGFAVFREMVEALITTAYIAAGNSNERADLYQDYLAVTRWKAAKEREGHPQLIDTIPAERLKSLEAAKDLVASRRGQQIVNDMTNRGKWKTWAGKLTVKQLAKDGGLSDVTYILGYAWPSQAIHGFDADRYFEINAEGIVRRARPRRTEAAVLPAAAVALKAMDVIDKFLGLRRRDAIMDLFKKIAQLSQKQQAELEN
jgi:Family of unknown function (DUF5677)